MKNIALFLLVIVIGIVMIACGNDGQGTYYPDNTEMQNNLESKGYEVNVQSVQKEGCSGTYLIAEKGDEYIEFYWLDDGNAVESIEQELETKYPNYAKLVSLENDSTFGSLVFCSSENSMEDAGIKIVEVKVNVKVNVK